MRVAFPTNNQQTIASHIGLAKGFLIVDTDTGEKFYIENPIMKKIQEEHIDLKNTEEGQRGLGTGRVIPPLLAEAGVDMLVSRDFGEGMIRNLEFEGIRGIQTESKDIEEVLNQIKEDEMKEVTRFNDIERYDDYEYGRGFGRGLGYARGFGFRRGPGFGRGMCHGRGFGRGYARGRGFGRGFGFRRED